MKIGILTVLGNTFFLDIFGNLYGCGQNDCGQLGIGNYCYTITPIKIMENVFKFNFKCSTLYILTKSGELFICGINYFDEPKESVSAFTHDYTNEPIKVIENVKDFWCGNMEVYVITYFDELFVAGNKYFKQIGNHNRFNIIPQLYFNNIITQISIGIDHVLFLSEDKVFVSGNNTYGELGTCNNEKSYGTIKIINLENIIYVFAGDKYSVFLDADGSIFTVGNNKFGQLGLGDYNDRNTPTKINNIKAIQIFATWNYFFILDESNKLFGVGYNYHGQLGLGDTNNRNILTEVGFTNIKKVFCRDFSTIILCDNDRIFGCGELIGLGHIHKIKTFINIPIDGNVVNIYHNRFNTFISTDIGLFVFGTNTYGELCLGDNVCRAEPTKIDFPYEIDQPEKLQKNANK